MSTGEGGMLVTDNESYAQRTRPLRSHGMTAVSYDKARGHATSYDVVELGFNYKIDDIRSSIGVVQLRKLPADLERRVAVREAYVAALADCPGITIPFLGHEGSVSNYIFPIVLTDSTAENRDRVRDELRDAGIETTVHYPAAHRFSIHRSDVELPVTEYMADNALSLPMHGRLEPNQVEEIAAALKEAVS
jgi:dTDP-4-amino-4,6-dideoxygalactose transaminase